MATTTSSGAQQQSLGNLPSSAFYKVSNNKISSLDELEELSNSDSNSEQFNDYESSSGDESSAPVKEPNQKNVEEKAAAAVVAEEKPQELPSQVHSLSHLLASYGFMNISANIYDKLRDIYPLVHVSNDLELEAMTNSDQCLANLFKCDAYHHGCYFTSPSEQAFSKHLTTAHGAINQLYCFYCTKSGHECDSTTEGEDEDNHSNFALGDQLIEHIKSAHGALKYQCNLCFYRAISADHVFMHQAAEHLGSFEQTLKRAIVDIDDELSPIEREFVHQTMDDEDEENEEGEESSFQSRGGNSAAEEDGDKTEVEDNNSGDDEENSNIAEESAVSSNQSNQKLTSAELCKILVVSNNSFEDGNEPSKTEVDYFNEFAEPKYDNTTNKTKLGLKCVYCGEEFATNARNASGSTTDEYWTHTTWAHPELPVLAWNLNPNQNKELVLDIKSRNKKFSSWGSGKLDIATLNTYTDLSKIDEELAEEIVSNFREQLALNSQDPSYDEATMSPAFEYYEAHAHELSAAAASSSGRTSSSKGTKRRLGDDGEDEVDGSSEGFFGPSKRRRLVDGLKQSLELSPSTLRRVRHAATVAVTAAVGFAFYHMTHLLPESVQSYLN